jgi:hypothetical protein
MIRPWSAGRGLPRRCGAAVDDTTPGGTTRFAPFRVRSLRPGDRATATAVARLWHDELWMRGHVSSGPLALLALPLPWGPAPRERLSGRVAELLALRELRKREVRRRAIYLSLRGGSVGGRFRLCPQAAPAPPVWA